jgi:hypothetical protein
MVINEQWKKIYAYKWANIVKNGEWNENLNKNDNTILSVQRQLKIKYIQLCITFMS